MAWRAAKAFFPSGHPAACEFYISRTDLWDCLQTNCLPRMKPIFKDPCAWNFSAVTQDNPELHSRAKPRVPPKLRIPGCNAARGPRAPRAPLPLEPRRGPEPGPPPLRGSARCLLGLVVFPAPAGSARSGISAAVWGAEAARARVRSARAGRRGRRSRQLWVRVGDPRLPGPWRCGCSGGRGPPVKFGVRSVRSGAGAGVSRAGLPERGAYWSESWKAWGAGECGAAAARGPRPPEAPPQAESVGRPGRLHLGEAAGGPGSPARARSGAAGVSLPAQLPSPHCFPDLGPRRRPAEEGVGSAPGGRRRGALRWLGSKVPSRPRLPVGPAVGGGGGDSRRATLVERGWLSGLCPPPHPGGGAQLLWARFSILFPALSL